MNKAETTKALALLKSNYHSFEVGQVKIDLWHELMGDVPFELILVAIKKYMLEDTSSFAPAIGKIRSMCLETATPQLAVTSGEAWGEVTRAISNYGGYREIEALASMSPITKRTVKAMNWQEICQCEDLGIMRAQFMRMYDSYKQREVQDKLIPCNMRPLLQSFIKDIPQLETREVLQIDEPKKERMEIPEFFKEAMKNVFQPIEKINDGTDEKKQKALEELKQLEGENG